MADRGLSHFLDALKAHGVENVRDLLNPELVPPEDLAGFEIGMNPDDVAALYTAGWVDTRGWVDLFVAGGQPTAFNRFIDYSLMPSWHSV